MPLYEFKCECGGGREILLPFQHPDQICECGEVMRRRVSLSGFTMKPNARDMALASINSKSGGFPDANENKAWVQRKAFEGV